MPDEIPGLPPAAAPDGETSASASAATKKKAKVRSAWISFVGRVVAQVVGAVATIGLGIVVLQKTQSKNETPASAPSPPAAVSRVVERSGEVALAVLPLATFSPESKDDYFADGMTEALIADLAQIRGLRVISRTSTMTYKGQQKPLPQVAQELNVDLIVEGSVVRAGERVRVTAQLIDARRDEHLWARSYERTLKDVLALQGEIAAAIATEVKGVLSPVQKARLVDRRPVDPITYDLYLRGRHAWNLRTPEGFKTAIKLFNEAIARDPEFALAYAGLADSYSLSGGGPVPTTAGPGMKEAKAAAERALELDEGLAEAHTSLAAVLHRGERKLDAAEQEFQRALQLNPGYATAHQWYALLLGEMARDKEALQHARQAVALDPLAAPMHQTLSLTHYFGRRYDDAITAGRRALELAPHLALARVTLGRALLAKGAVPEAIAVCEQAERPLNPDLLVTLGVAHLRAGHPQQAKAAHAELIQRKPVPVIALARWHAAAGEPKAALDYLERATRDGGPGVAQSLRVDPRWDPLRSEPRFAQLLQKLSAS